MIRISFINAEIFIISNCMVYLEKIMYCQYCGKPIVNNAKYCSHCGQRIMVDLFSEQRRNHSTIQIHEPANSIVKNKDSSEEEKLHKSIWEELQPNEKIITRIHPSIWAFFWDYLSVIVIFLLGIIFGILFPIFYLFFWFLAFLFFIYIELYRRGIIYYLTNMRIIQEKRFISRSIASTLYSKITDVYLTQGLIERSINIGKIMINTPGTPHFEFKLIGINDPISIKRFIEKQMIENQP